MSLRGFTLVEMAVVLLILGLLLSGLLPLYSARVEQQRIQETRLLLADVREALLGFAVGNGRLPCPANAQNMTTPGVELLNGSGVSAVCAATQGVVPWVTLGVAGTDAWGRRLGYRVTSGFADGADGADGTGDSCALSVGVSFQLCSLGNMTAYNAVGGSKVAASIPAMIVSYGKNGAGGYSAEGVRLADGVGDERENSDDNATFVEHEMTAGFDDLVLWLSPNILLNRMVVAGRLP